MTTPHTAAPLGVERTAPDLAAIEARAAAAAHAAREYRYCRDCGAVDSSGRAGWMCRTCGTILPSDCPDAKATAIAAKVARDLGCADLDDVPDAEIHRRVLTEQIDAQRTRADAAEEALTTAREERDAARAEAAGLRAAHDEKADTCERLYADYCDALSERDAAQREIARMRSAVEGRISPPSAAEMREHMESGGAWLVTEPAVRGLRPTSVTHYVERYARATVLWWTEGALWVAVRDGRPCPSPVLP